MLPFTTSVNPTWSFSYMGEINKLPVAHGVHRVSVFTVSARRRGRRLCSRGIFFFLFIKVECVQVQFRLMFKQLLAHSDLEAEEKLWSGKETVLEALTSNVNTPHWLFGL